MKKLFTAILAISALVACNRDYVVESVNQSVITFDDSFVEIKTRAAEDPSTTTASIDKFDVWGYMKSEAGVVFEKERVSKTDAGWTYANLQYWMPEQNYYFAAVSPVDDANIKINTENRSFNAPTGLGVIEFTNEKGTNENGINVNGTTDLLYAEKSLSTDADATNEDKVHLQFAHMLSKVKFTFVNALPNEIQIKNIKINNAPKSASIDMTAETRAWANYADDEVVLDFGNVKKGEKLDINEKQESDYARLTLPVGGEYEYNITFDVYVYHGTEAGHIAHSTTLTDAEFMIGKAYNLTAVISPENLGLQPIEFTVDAVDEWDNGGEYDIYAPEGDDDEPETPVVPEEPEVKETKLYLKPNANWNMDNARFAAYMWNNSGDVWFDMTLVEGETNIYEFTLPEGYSNIIFCRMNPGAADNNWNNKWNQTGDLVVPTDGMNMFVVPESAWDGATTGWKTYTPATTPEEPSEPEIVIPGEGLTYDIDYRYTTLVDGLDANNSLRVAQENGWTWDIKFNPGLSEIIAGDYTAVQGFTTADALEVDTYMGGFQNNTYNYIYPDEFDKVTTFNVQKEGDIYCITMIGSGGYGNDVGSFRCVYIGKIKSVSAE